MVWKVMIMDYNIPTGGYSREEKSVFLKFQLFCYKYKKLMKISYVGLYKIYYWPKFEGHNSLNKTAMPLRSSKLKWAWRAQFFSQTLQILGKVIFFENLQMILLSSEKAMRKAKIPYPELNMLIYKCIRTILGGMSLPAL